MSTDAHQNPIIPPILSRPTYRGRYQLRPSIFRAYRSKYAPHVGKKQLAKMEARKRNP